MKILSRFTDYYDYVEYLYSPEGGDPKNTYNRVISTNTVNVKGYLPSYPQPKQHLPGSGRKLEKGYDGWRDFPWRYKWCVVCGKMYLLVHEGKYDFVDRDGQSVAFQNLSKFRVITPEHPSWELTGYRSYRQLFEKVNAHLHVGRPEGTCGVISKVVGAPVFVIQEVLEEQHYHGSGKSDLRVTLHPEVPNLGQLGFASLISPEQMYQEIAMYLSSLKESPDNQPPAKVSDKDRLVQKGFDTKVSFRGKAT